jgi:deazaflavin-dependent oxidoreductase (nitroreductase family)
MSEQEVPPAPDWLPQEVWAQVWRTRSEEGQRQFAREEVAKYLQTKGDMVSGFGEDLAFAFGAEPGQKMVDNHLLLTHIGRKSGKEYTTPLIFLKGDGDDHIVIGSFGGLPKHPQWVLNLLAHPEAAVQVGDRRWPVKARFAEGEERARLWERVEKYFKLWAHFQKFVDREFAVVILSRSGPPQAVESEA